MEPPSKFERDAIRDEKRKVLRALRPTQGSAGPLQSLTPN
jgi:glucose-6-phosphate 1-dehydrogenase